MKNPIQLAIRLTALMLLLLGAWYWVNGPHDDSPAISALYKEPPEGAMRVLFIGNSHTFVHDIPLQVQHLGAAAEVPIWVEAETRPGGTLDEHWQAGDAARLIDEGGWDFVVLQEQTLLPAMDSERYLTTLKKFVERVEAAGAKPLVYSVWRRAPWDDFYKLQQNIRTPKELNEQLTRAYHEAEKIPGVRLAPVGTSWTLAAATRPDLMLYSEDGNHANPAGAYLAACVLYRVLTGRAISPNSFIYPGVSKKDATDLQQVADRAPDYWASFVAPPKPPPRSRRFRQPEENKQPEEKDAQIKHGPE